jgi:hypothetical protein
MAFAMFARTGRAPEGDSAATVPHADLDAFYTSVEQLLDPCPPGQADCGDFGFRTIRQIRRKPEVKARI